MASQKRPAEQERHRRLDSGRSSHASPRDQVGVEAAHAGRISSPVKAAFAQMNGRGQHANEEICKSKWSGYLRRNSVARGRHKLESVLDSLDSGPGTQRVCFHLRVLIFPARGKTCRIESAFRELEYPNILTVRFVSIGF